MQWQDEKCTDLSLTENSHVEMHHLCTVLTAAAGRYINVYKNFTAYSDESASCSCTIHSLVPYSEGPSPPSLSPSQYPQLSSFINLTMLSRAKSVRLASAATVVKRDLSMCEYTQLEEAQVKTDSRMCFAVYDEKALYSTSVGTESLMAVRQLPRPDLRSLIGHLPGLRCRSGFTCFNIYPTSQMTLDVNRFLWDTVHNGFYDSVKGNALFSTNIFVLGLPAELFDFLVHVTLEALDVAIIDFLVLLHHQLTTDGDVIGVSKLQEELLPEVWNRLEANIGVFENGEPKEAERAATLEHLVQISFMTPWRVDVLAGYLSPADMGLLLDHGPRHLSGALPAFGSDCVGVRGSALLKMFRDWQVYDDVLCKRLSMKRCAALEAMDRAIYVGRSECMYGEAAAVVDLCDRKQSYFSLLPMELIERAVIPWIVRRNCETIAPRQRRLATLKSLLELSSKFFDDLEAGGNGFEEDVVMAGEGDGYGEALYDGYNNGGDNLQIGELAIGNIDGDSSGDATTPSDGAGDAGMSSDAVSPSGSWESEEEYPLDAGPRRYSRMERHGGIIDLAAGENNVAVDA